MPSPAPCSGSPGEPGRSPTVRHCTFPGRPPDLPTRMTEGVSGLPIPCRVAPPHWPYIRFLFVGSPFCRRLPPHAASLRRSCPWLAVPLLAARRGLAPPSSVSCVAHMGPGIRRKSEGRFADCISSAISSNALSGAPARIELGVSLPSIDWHWSLLPRLFWRRRSFSPFWFFSSPQSLRHSWRP